MITPVGQSCDNALVVYLSFSCLSMSISLKSTTAVVDLGELRKLKWELGDRVDIRIRRVCAYMCGLCACACVQSKPKGKLLEVWAEGCEWEEEDRFEQLSLSADLLSCLPTYPQTRTYTHTHIHTPSPSVIMFSVVLSHAYTVQFEWTITSS